MKDPYSWLEDKNSDKTKTWYEAQNKLVDDYNHKTPVEYFKNAILEYSDADVRGLSSVYGKYEFWMERQAGWQKPKLIVRNGARESVVIDMHDYPSSSLDYWYPSPSGKTVIYGMSKNGSEQTTLRVKDTRSGNELKDVIPYAGFTDLGSICWSPDEKSFYYLRTRGFDQPEPTDKVLLGTKLYKHFLGTSPTDDVCVFGSELPDVIMIIPSLSIDGSKMIVSVSEDELTHQLFSLNTISLETHKITPDVGASFETHAGIHGFYVHTNWDAGLYKLLYAEYTDYDTNMSEWDDILPESTDVLQAVWPHRSGSVIAEYSKNVCSELRVFDEYGNQTAVIETPEFGSVSGVSTSMRSSKVFVMTESFTAPPSLYKLSSLNTRPILEWRRDHLPGDVDIGVKQVWADSKDGTKIPYFVIKKSDSNTTSPTVLYGYGGFNIALTPGYLGSMRSWVLAGGTYVIANLRGGSEFGEPWHKAGAMKHKQNTFDDYIAIAERLITDKETTSDQLGVMGGSNGGLLVAAVTVQRPDLFRAGVSLVPLTDMLEFYKHDVAEFWVHEYGDPRTPEQREWIMKWSPYHNVGSNCQMCDEQCSMRKKCANYNEQLSSSSTLPIAESFAHSVIAHRTSTPFPAMYFDTAMHDARVHAFHAFKMTAKLQDFYARNTKGPLLLRTQRDTGHQGSNLSKEQRAAQTAGYLAFLAHELKLSV